MTLFVTKRETPIGEVVARRSERGPVSMRFSDGKTDVSADRVDPDPAVGDAIDRYFAGSTAALGAEVGTSGRVVGNAMSANPRVPRPSLSSSDSQRRHVARLRVW